MYLSSSITYPSLHQSIWNLKVPSATGVAMSASPVTVNGSPRLMSTAFAASKAVSSKVRLLCPGHCMVGESATPRLFNLEGTIYKYQIMTIGGIPP